MDLLPTLINALVIGLVGALITYVTRTQVKDLRDEMRDLRDEMKEGFAEVKDGLRQVRQEIRDVETQLRIEFRTEFASIRSDMTQIALAVGAQPRPQAG